MYPLEDEKRRTVIRKPKLALLTLLTLLLASICRSEFGAGTTMLPRPSGDVQLSALEESFRVPPDDAKIMVRWWWFGPAVTTEELDRELHEMKDAGIGGFEVQP